MSVLAIDSSLVRGEIMGLLLLGAVVFYQLSHADTVTVLSLVVMAILAAASAVYLSHRTEQEGRKGASVVQQQEASIEGRREANVDPYQAARFPRQGRFKHLPRNPRLSAMAHDLLFVRKFDPARFGDLLLLLDKLQKHYVYILGGRYPPAVYLATFLDMRDAVLENLYSMYVVVPMTLKHTFGLMPHEVLRRNIALFTSLSRRMVHTLESYARHQEGDAFVLPSLPRPAHDPALAAHRLP